jgi:hypothetical protein
MPGCDVNDPLPPSIEASPYRAGPSAAALPLCKGEKVFVPLVKGDGRRVARAR